MVFELVAGLLLNRFRILFNSMPESKTVLYAPLQSRSDSHIYSLPFIRTALAAPLLWHIAFDTEQVLCTLDCILQEEKTSEKGSSTNRKMPRSPGSRYLNHFPKFLVESLRDNDKAAFLSVLSRHCNTLTIKVFLDCFEAYNESLANIMDSHTAETMPRQNPSSRKLYLATERFLQSDEANVKNHLFRKTYFRTFRRSEISTLTLLIAACAAANYWVVLCVPLYN